jgi:Isochorismatase family
MSSGTVLQKRNIQLGDIRYSFNPGPYLELANRSPHEGQRNAGFPDCASAFALRTSADLKPAKARAASDGGSLHPGYASRRSTMTHRILPESCAGAIIDVQDFFLAQLDGPEARARMETNLVNFARLLDYFRIPIVVTLERPVAGKGGLPDPLAAQLTNANVFEKDFFDLAKEKKIRDHLAGLKKKQIVVAGCETDVCVLQSCLGLIDLGYDVFVVEDLVFSSALNVETAFARLQAEGVAFLTYKTLYYELIQAVGGGRHADAMVDAFGPFPDDLPDHAV